MAKKHKDSGRVAVLEEAQEPSNSMENSKGTTRRGVPPPISRLAEGRKLIAFGWYGGKFSHLDWLLPLLP